MKSLISCLIILTVYASIAPYSFSQEYIRSIPTSGYAPPTINTGNMASGVKSLMDILTIYAQAECLEEYNKTLEKQLKKANEEYIPKFPSGSTLELQILVNKSTCEAFSYVNTTQIVRANKNQCSVDDIKVERPALVYDPNKTGFITVNLKLEEEKEK